MSKFLIDYDPMSGLFSEFAYDAIDNQYVLNSAQDVSGIIEANKIDMNTPQKTLDGLGRKVASIPLCVWQDLRNKGIAQDEVAFKRWLNDSDNRFFRTTSEVV